MRTFVLTSLFILISSCATYTETGRESGTRETIELRAEPYNLPQDKHVKKLDADCIINSCLTLIVANVGQGSGAVARLPNNQTMLIDAGYSANPSDGDPLTNFVWAANQIGVTKQTPFDYVVLSHPDKDHVNLIDKLYAQGYISLSITKSIHLGRMPGEYATQMKAKEFFDAIYAQYPTGFEDCNNNKKIDVEISVYCYPPDGAVPTAFYQPNWPHDVTNKWAAYMISVNTGGNGATMVNSNSLVVGFYHGGRVVGVLPGDATEVTTDAILASAPGNASLYSNVVSYAISHHGSDTHGSNKLDWLKVLKANIYVASNARYGKWRHPSNKITKEIMNQPTLKNAVLPSAKHKLFQAYTDDLGVAAFCYCNNFDKSIFSTFSNGWLRVVVDSQGKAVAVFQSVDILPKGYEPCISSMCY